MTLPFAIHTFGAKPHQRGYAFDGVRAHYTAGREPDAENPNGPVKVLVRAGKALNAKGRELLRKPQ